MPSGNPAAALTIRDSGVNGNVGVTNPATTFSIGGIVGELLGSNNIIDGCYFNGELTTSVGSGATITTGTAVGGIVGRITSTATQNNQISNSYSAGDFSQIGTAASSTSTYFGGIVGSGTTASALNITNSYSTAYINSKGRSAGIAAGGTLSPIVTNSIALNPYINGNLDSARVGININAANSSNNYAHSGLSLNVNQDPDQANLVDGSVRDGEAIDGGGFTADFFRGLGFSEGTWDLDFAARDYKLPVLRRTGGGQEDFPMPEYQ
jgi:hypothetical protein